jgi:probable HAF family extracellular repeat protein
MKRKDRISIALALALGATAGLFAQNPQFTTMDGPGATATLAWGVNKYRDVVGLYTLPDKTDHGFLFRLGKLTAIDYPGASSTDVYGINSRGDIVGGYTAKGLNHGFLLSAGKYTTVDYPGCVVCSLAAINDQGDIITAIAGADNVGHGVLYSQGRFSLIEYPGATSTSANGSNNRGDVAGNYTVGSVTRGFVLSNGLFTSIEVPGAAFTGAYGINLDGTVAGRYRDAAGVAHGFTLRDGTPTTLDIPGATYTAIDAINDVGDVAGRYIAGGVNRAFLMRQPGVSYTLTDLGTLPGGKFSQASFIDRNGVVLGLSDLPDKSQHAVVWQAGRIADISKPGLGGPNSALFSMNRWGQLLGQAESSAADPNKEDFCAYGTGLKCLPFLYQNGFTMALPTLGGPNGTVGNINRQGEAVGVAENNVKDPACPAGKLPNGTGPQVLQFEAVIWGSAQGQVRELRPLAGDTVGAALWINDQGQAVGTSGLCSNTLYPPIAMGPHTVLWERDGSARDLGSMGGTVDTESLAGNVGLAINNRSQVVGASALAGNKTAHAFLWTPEIGMRDLGTLEGDAKSAGGGINERGEIVGVSFDEEFNPRGYLWRHGEMTDFNDLIPADSPLYVLWTTAINDDGEVVGFGATATGDIHAFLAKPNVKPADHVAGPAGRPTLSPNIRELVRQRLPHGMSGVPPLSHR